MTKYDDFEIAPFRNHPTYIVEQMWGILLVLFLILFQNTALAAEVVGLIKSGRLMEALIAFAGGFFVLIIVMAWYINRWYRTTISLKDYTLTIQRNTLNRMVNSISVNNISNINLERNLFEMVVGTCKVKLDTNSLSTANSTDVKIVLSRRKAEELRDILTEMLRELNGEMAGEREEAGAFFTAHEKGQEIVQDEMVLPETVSDGIRPERGVTVDYTNPQIIRNCVMNTKLSAFFAIVLAAIGSVAAIITGESEIKADSIIGMIVIVLFIGYTFFSQFVKKWLADFNFKARREGDKIYVKFGLLTEDHYTVPVDKINAIVIESTMLGRIFGYSSLKVINVGGEKDDVDGMKLLLADKEEELKRKMQMLLPEFDFPVMKEMKRQPKSVLVKRSLTTLIWACLFLLGIYAGLSRFMGPEERFFIKWIWVPVVILAFLVEIGILLSYRVTKLAGTEQMLLFSSGTFGKTVVSIPYEKMQYISISKGPLERLLSIEHATIFILANTLRQAQTTGYFKEGEFEDLIEKLRNTYLKVEQEI